MRLFYNSRFILDDEYLTKYKGNRVVFKIKRADVLKIRIKRARWYDFFAFLYDAIPSQCSLSHGTNISFLFKSCEILESEKTEIPRHSIKNKYEDKDLQEYVEILSLREATTLCRRLRIYSP